MFYFMALYNFLSSLLCCYFLTVVVDIILKKASAINCCSFFLSSTTLCQFFARKSILFLSPLLCYFEIFISKFVVFVVVVVFIRFCFSFHSQVVFVA